MGHQGTLILADEQGRERRVPCEGGLDTYVFGDGGLRVRGIVSVEGDGLAVARGLMERARTGAPPMARYSGEVYTEARRETREVEDLSVRIEAIDETGNVRVESDESLSA